MTFDADAMTSGLAAAQAALDAYEYDRARELLDTALVESRGGLDAARALLELLVDVLGLDSDALAVEPKLARPARRDLRVRSRLALAAARTGQISRALAWIEGETAPEVVGALLACAHHELSVGQVDRAQGLLERARRIDPSEPRLSELERLVRDEKRFRVLLLEEELETLLTRNDPGTEAVARALLARDGHNAKAAQVIERAEIERAEASARELLLRVRHEPPTATHSDRWARELRAASAQRLAPELCHELTELAHDLEARAAEDASRSAIEALVGLSGSEGSSTAELVESYLELSETSRRRAREQTRAPLFDWIDALALRRGPPRATVRSLDALRRASALADRDPRAALALLEPELGSLRRLAAATELRAKLVDAGMQARQASARQALEHAEDALHDAAAQRALDLLATLSRGVLDAELRRRADDLTARAEAALNRERLERAVRANREQGRLLDARRALDELIGSRLLDTDAQTRAAELRLSLADDIRRQFVLERIDGPIGDWWRGLLHETMCHSHPHCWLATSSRLAVVPVHAERWLLLVEIQPDTGLTQGALLVRLPRILSTPPNVTLRDTKLTLVSGDAEVCVIDIAAAQIETWESDHAPPDQIVEQCWMSSDPRRLWLALRRRGDELDSETLRLYDRQSRRIVAEFGDQLNATPVLGHSEADVVVRHYARPTVVDAGGRPLAWKPPDGITSAAVHPSGEGLLVASADYDDTGAITLHELAPGQRPRSLEVDMSGESLHTIGVSRADRLVVALGITDQRELMTYRSTAQGLELLWNRPCGRDTQLLGDAACDALYVLHASARPDAGWLTRVSEQPIDAAISTEDDATIRPRFDAFEPDRCPGRRDDTPRPHDPVIIGPARNAPSALLDEFVRAHPRDYHGLRRLWSRAFPQTRSRWTDASGLELQRLAQAHPGSAAVRLLAAQEHAGDGGWGEARRLLRALGPGDVEAEDVRHLCHLQALGCLLARDLVRARVWLEEGARHAGSCDLQPLELAASPLPPPGTAVARSAIHSKLESTADPEPTSLTFYRCLLRDLDTLLDSDPVRVLEHPAFDTVATGDVQLLARQASAWLRLEAHSPETRARRTIELARFCAAFRLLEPGPRERFLPEAWSLEEVLSLRDRAQQALGDDLRSSPASTEETGPRRPPPLPHEAAARHIPGFEELLDALLPSYGSAAHALDARRIREADLLAASSVRRVLAREHRRQMLEGHSRREARDRTRALGALLAASVNHALSLRKTFWVDDALAAKLQHTRLDVHGTELNLPFPSCAFVLTEPTALSLALQLVRLDPNWRQMERVSVITAYLARTADGVAPAPNDAATLHVQLALSPWGRTVPWILTRDLRLEPAADLDAILDSHLEDAVERELEPWLGSRALRDLLAIILNAVLYSTSVEARPELLTGQPQRPPGERLVLSGESVFYLPDKIEINDGPLGDSASSALDVDSTPLRSIQHRVAVRGHWRRPHPQASDRRLRWVRPHFRGPREAVLIEREYRVGEGTVDRE